MTSQAVDLQMIYPGLMFDGRGGEPISGAAVLIQGDRILWVGPREQVGSASNLAAGLSGDNQWEELDFPDGTLLPGLIDCHTHTNMPGDGRTGEEVNLDSDDVRLMRSAGNVRRALESGVTTLCDCGAWNSTAFSLKQGIDLGLVDGPRVLAAGPPVTVTGGHLWYMGGEADGVAGVRLRVRQLIKEGVDFIKVVASGGSTVTSDPFRPSFTLDEFRAITEEAHNRGKPVAAHCRSTVAINRALDAEVDLVLHGWCYDPDGSYRFDQATADRLADSQVWVNPTLYIGRPSLALLRQKRDQEELSSDEQAQLQRMEQSAKINMEQTSKLIQMGVKLVGGSDCGWGSYPFGDFQGELLAMTEAGLSPTQAILAGTRDAALALEIGDSVGTIEADKQADLLLVEGNPTNDITALRSVVTVFHGGRRITR